MKRVWCSNCGAMVDYRVMESLEEYQWDAVKARYNKKIPRCMVCNMVLFVPEIVTQNQMARVEALNKEREAKSD